LRQLKRKFKQQLELAEEELVKALKMTELDELAELLLDFQEYSELKDYLAKPKLDKN